MIHNRHPIRAALAVTVALLATAASPALARPAAFPPPAHPVHLEATTVATASPCSEVCSGGYIGTPQQLAAAAAFNAAHPRPSQATTVRVVTHSNGFDWGDAAIGAGVAIVLILIAVGGVRVSANRRAHPLGGESVSAAR
jgi:hypothetical protein